MADCPECGRNTPWEPHDPRCSKGKIGCPVMLVCLILLVLLKVLAS
jgi:hypothetical protein